MTEPLWAHQERAIELALPALDTGGGFGIWHGMGTGKTRTALEILDIIGIDRVLIVCPKTVLTEHVWQDEITEYVPHWDAYIVPLIGTGKKRAAILHHARYGNSDIQVVITNYDGMWRDAIKEPLLKFGFDAVIFDEIHRIKKPSGKASRYAARLAQTIPIRLGLTGTPIPHSDLDAWAVYRAINPLVLPRTYTLFKARYTRPAFMSEWRDDDVLIVGKIGDDLIRLKLRNRDELARKMYSIAHRVKTEDAVDLPPSIDTRRTTTLEPAAKRMYAELDKEFITWVKTSGDPVTAANVMAKILRLQQITGGTVPDEAGVEQRVSHAKEKLLTDIFLDVADEPVVVFGRFKSDLRAIHFAAESAGLTSLELSGSLHETAAWKAGKAQVLAVQEQAGGLGIDLTRARLCIYYSLTYNLGDYEQTRRRVLRPGQTRSVDYIHLVCEGTVDEDVYTALARRENVVAALVDGARSRRL